MPAVDSVHDLLGYTSYWHCPALPRGKSDLSIRNFNCSERESILKVSSLQGGCLQMAFLIIHQKNRLLRCRTTIELCRLESCHPGNDQISQISKSRIHGLAQVDSSPKVDRKTSAVVNVVPALAWFPIQPIRGGLSTQRMSASPSSVALVVEPPLNTSRRQGAIRHPVIKQSSIILPNDVPYRTCLHIRLAQQE